MSLDQARSICSEASTIVRHAAKEEKEQAKAKVKAAKLITELVELGQTEKEARRQVTNLSSLRKDVVKRIKNRTELAKIRQAPEDVIKQGTPKVKFLHQIQDGATIQMGGVYTTSEVRQAIAAVAYEHCIPDIMQPLTQKKKKRKNREQRFDSEQAIVTLLKDIYVVSRTAKKVGDKKLRAYKIKGFIDLELSASPPPVKKVGTNPLPAKRVDTDPNPPPAKRVDTDPPPAKRVDTDPNPPPAKRVDTNPNPPPAERVDTDPNPPPTGGA